MWRLVRDNVLGFTGMFKDSHIWLQIMQRNQMSEESRFPNLKKIIFFIK